jgi:hypothetical protein
MPAASNKLIDIGAWMLENGHRALLKVSGVGCRARSGALGEVTAPVGDRTPGVPVK